MIRNIQVAAVLVVLTMCLHAADFPVPKNLGDPQKLGHGIQRAMTLLAESTPERRNTVRVLFYGQSITEQNWSKLVADDLRKRFPNANLIVENRALGGFASQMLVKTAETDLYSFYPDLLIFHVYGAHDKYEDIIRRTRERTTADVLMMTDHVTKEEQFTEETDPAKLYPNGKIWDSFMNYKHLPEVARKYGCALLDQRNLWKQYLKDYNLPPKELLKDGVHLNDHGCFVMAAFVSAYLVKRDDEPVQPFACDRINTLPFAAGSMYKTTVDGNRIDVVLRGACGEAFSVLIDGKKPSEHPELYGFTRALAKPGSKWPPIAPITSEAPLLLEEWTLTAKQDATNPKVYAFTLSGSKTGPDGEGRSDAKFVSNSKRIVIAPENWNVDFALGVLAGLKPVPKEMVVRWQVVPHFVDDGIITPTSEEGNRSVVTLAQGLENGKHEVELKAEARLPIEAVRVYAPPVKAAPR